MMIKGEGVAVATEAVTALTVTETGLGTGTGTEIETEIDVVMISTVERGADLRVGRATVIAMNEIDEEREMIWTTQESKMTAPRGNVKMTASKIKLLSRIALAVTAWTVLVIIVILEVNTMSALGLVKTEILDVIAVVKMMTSRTSELDACQRKVLRPSSKSH